MTTTHDHDAETLKQLLAELGVTPESLQRSLKPVPTLAEYLPRVIAATGPAARRTYSTYWTRILGAFGDRRLDQIHRHRHPRPSCARP